MPYISESLGALGASCGSPPSGGSTANMSDVHPAFFEPLDRLLDRIYNSGLPFQIARIGRTLDWQCWAMCNGGSKLKDPSRSAHTKGLAVDFRLTKRGGSLGVNKARTQVTDGEAYAYWSALGSIINTEFPELKWGGDWKKGAELIGWDPYHVELRDYRSYLPKGSGYYKCENGRAVKVTGALETAAAAVDRAVQENVLTIAQNRGAKIGLGAILAGAAVAGGAWWYLKIRKNR